MSGGGGIVMMARRHGRRCQEGRDAKKARMSWMSRAGRFERGEVAAGVEVAPVHDVVGLLGVAADGHILGENGYPGGHR
jgi:hypothetical protein